MSDMPELERPSSTTDQSLAGIGGWLILPAIGLILGIILGVLMLGVSLGHSQEFEAEGLGGLFKIEILAQLGLTVFMIWVAMRFFAKKRDAPTLFIVLMVTNLVLNVVLLALEVSAGAEGLAEESLRQLIRAGIGAAIWIPYFRVSKRVQATFVN
jgi:hypothetical protein